jgi:hypothetical protein
MLPEMPQPEKPRQAELWIPLVDEPIGAIVERIRQEHAEIAALVSSPDRLLAFRTFAYIRVGILLGRLFVETDAEAGEGATWADRLADEHHDEVVAEVRAVAEDVAAEAREPIGPSDAERARFSEFAKRQLAADT